MKDGKKQEIEEEVPLEEIKEIEPEKEPEKIKIRTKPFIKDGQIEEEIPKEEKKPEETIKVEELPSEDITYKVVKYGSKRYPQTKVMKVRKIIKYGREQENEEQITSEELIYQPIKY